jgi:hypothetical protein
MMDISTRGVASTATGSTGSAPTSSTASTRSMTRGNEARMIEWSDANSAARCFAARMGQFDGNHKPNQARPSPARA